MQKFLAWEKAILIYSTFISAVLTLVGVVLFPTLGPSMNIDIPSVGETLKLGIGGWIGLIGISTIIILISFGLGSFPHG